MSEEESSANNDGLSWRTIMETVTPHFKLVYFIKRILCSTRTKYQEVDIVEIPDFGKTLFIDGKLQSSVNGEWVYHESLVHPVMIAHPNPKRILIIGGGEGATLREVLKHNTVNEAVMVDLDPDVIELCKKYLPELHQGSFEDPRSKLCIADGREFLSKHRNEYDVIIVDLTDPIKDTPSVFLYTREFYQLVFNALKEDGLFVTQATSIIHTPDIVASIYKTVADVFPIARVYHVWVSCFSSLWGFVLGSKKYDPTSLTRKELVTRMRERGLIKRLKFYDEIIHEMLFHLPKFIREDIKRRGRLSTDKNPVYLLE
ncbi:MAG: polyamine aminopropyltransferase [Thermoprotei archaeon]|nr:polyamine aminopropyltransferase [Thermoprotei archaeon]